VRMYELVTLLGVVSMYTLIRRQDSPHRHLLIAYVAVTTAALYTHYYAGFLVLGQALYLLLIYLLNRQTEKNSLWSHLLPLVWVGMLYLPWLIYAGPRLLNYINNKHTVEGYAPLNFIRFFGDHFVAFSVGHLSDMLQQYVWTDLLDANHQKHRADILPAHATGAGLSGQSGLSVHAAFF
jgi:uncharacterized membrane protein